MTRSVEVVAQLAREGKPPWYHPYRRETSVVRRMTRRKARLAAKRALALGQDAPRERGTCGWLSW